MKKSQIRRYIKLASSKSPRESKARLKSAAFKILVKYLSPTEPFKIEKLNQISTDISNEYFKHSNQPTLNRTVAVDMDVFTSQKIDFAMCAGKFCYWELLVKQTAEQVNIPVFESQTRKNATSPSLREIEPIIDDIKNYYTKLHFDFGSIVNLRNAVVHGNFHQLRTHSSKGISKKISENFKANVIEVDLTGATDAENLSEIKEIEKIKEKGISSWFMDVALTDIFLHIEKKLMSHINLLNDLRTFISMIKENTDLMNRFVANGYDLTKQEEDSLANHFKFIKNSRSLFISVKGMNKKFK